MAVNRKNTAAAQTAKKSAASAKSIIQSGRGLGALLAKQNVSRVPQNSEMAPLADIEPNPHQPRKSSTAQRCTNWRRPSKFMGCFSR